MKHMPHILLAVGLSAGLMSAAPAFAGSKACPYGLDKKSHTCVAPGQAKKHAKSQKHSKDHAEKYHRYNVGERIDRDYIVIREPKRYGLDPRYTYYRVEDDVFRVDSETRKVINFIGAAAALMN